MYLIRSPHSPILVKSLKKVEPATSEGAATSKALLLKVYYNQNNEEAIKGLLENMRTEYHKDTKTLVSANAHENTA